MSLQAVWSAYHRGEKQNGSHYKAYCKGCVRHKEAQAELLHPSWLLPAEINAESELMQALAEIDEDERPDDGVVEIHSDDEYVG